MNYRFSTPIEYGEKTAFRTLSTPRDPGSRPMSLVPGDGGFPIQIGGGFLYNTYPYVSCMYLACILHVFRCVPFIDIKIHQDTSRYICIWHFGCDDGIETFPQPPRYVSCMYPACIPHVSRMCPACILITTEDTCIPHVSRVSRMYPACIPSYQIHLSPDAFEIHVSHYVSHYVSRMYLVCILITSEDTCILHVSRMYLAPQIRTVFPPH